jgi:cell division protease FtsH
MSAILTERYARAKQLLIDHRDALERVAQALLERETLEESDLRLLLEGRPLPLLPDPAARGAAGAAVKPSAETEDGSRRRFGEKPMPDPEPVPG